MKRGDCIVTWRFFLLCYVNRGKISRGDENVAIKKILSVFNEAVSFSFHKSSRNFPGGILTYESH